MTEDLNWYDLLNKFHDVPSKDNNTNILNLKVGSASADLPMSSYTPWLLRSSPSSSLLKLGVGSSEYFNNLEVREALHIPKHIQAWESCTGRVKYQCLEKGSFWIYPYLKGRIRILIASGDTDGAVPYLGTIKWISMLEWKKIEDRRQWTLHG